MIAKGCFHLEFEPPIKSIFALSLVPGLKVTTRRAVINISSPVFRFLPGRATLSRSSILPKSDILTDSARSWSHFYFLKKPYTPDLTITLFYECCMALLSIYKRIPTPSHLWIFGGILTFLTSSLAHQ